MERVWIASYYVFTSAVFQTRVPTPFACVGAYRFTRLLARFTPHADGPRCRMSTTAVVGLSTAALAGPLVGAIDAGIVASLPQRLLWWQSLGLGDSAWEVDAGDPTAAMVVDGLIEGLDFHPCIPPSLRI